MKIITARPHRLLDVCINRIGELTNAGMRCMLLVPSQYTLQAEVEVMTRLNIHGSFLIDVLSPSRLRSRVFERAGMPNRIIIDERGKSMVLSAIIEEEQENLCAYRAAAAGAGQGLAMKLSAFIADLKRSGTTPQELAQAIEGMEEKRPARQKLKDVLRIYAAYEVKMAGKLADEEDIAQEVRKKLERSGVVSGQNVFVYGFDMITPAFAEDLLHMAALAESVSLLIETDKNSSPDGRLFAPVNGSIDRLEHMAREKGIEIKRERIDAPLDAPKDICILEKGLFALGEHPSAERLSSIEVHAASNPRTEVHMAAAKMRSMMASGIAPTEMAVVYSKGSDYAPLLQNILPTYGIDVYVAEKRTAGAHPLCRFVLSALAVISGGWRTSDLIECIHSGFVGLTTSQADALCSYVEGVDLRGNAWKQPLTYIKNGSKEELEALDKSRERIVQPLMAFSNRLSAAKTADDTVGAVIALLEDVQAFERLTQMKEELKDEGQTVLADDCVQVWNRLMETLDQLHTLLAAQSVTAQTVRGLLESGLSAMELAALPPVDGAVICGEIGNVRTAEISTLFAIGMNDAAGEIKSALLTPEEAEEAARATKAYLGMSASERAALAQMDILKTLSGAKERLIVSYALSDETGRALREGIAIQALRRLFVQMTVQGGLAQEELESMLCSPAPAAQALSVMLSDTADGRNELSTKAAQAYAVLLKNEERSEELLDITRKLSQPSRPRLDGVQARKLYGRPVMSVSRLETFAQCPYKHFVRYGLSPQEEVRPGVDRAELGTLYHEAAESFTRAVTQLPQFPQVEPEICDRLMMEAAAPLIEEWRQSPLGRSARGASIAARIEKTAKRAGRNIVSQFAGGGFKPMQSEMIFGERGMAPIMLELSDGTMLYLRGRIDRVDVMDENKLIRVIDYKSGTKKFDPTMVYWGLQLQLLIYLAAALARIPGSSAAGFFYCRIADPTIRSESRVKEEIEKQIAKKLSLAGISLSDVKVLRAQGESHAAMITREGKANGRYAASMADEEGMQELVEFAKGKASEIAQEAYFGVIEDAPAEYGQYNACALCRYAAVCGFDPSRNKRRRLAGKKLEDLMCNRK